MPVASNVITLDAIAGIQAHPDAYFNERRSLQMLSAGLVRIAHLVKKREEEWARRTHGRIKLHITGLDFDGTKGQLDLIGCLFHWFGVSVVNYARLIGYVHGLASGEFSQADLEKPDRFSAIREAVDRYVRGVPELQDVLVWRHKIGAHHAITAPRREDNVATLEMSVMFPVSFSGGRYRVSELSYRRSGGSGSHASSIPSWSLTEVFEALCPRYWPRIQVGEPDREDTPEAD